MFGGRDAGSRQRTAVKVLLVERCWASNSRNQKTTLLGDQLVAMLSKAMMLRGAE